MRTDFEKALADLIADNIENEGAAAIISALNNVNINEIETALQRAAHPEIYAPPNEIKNIDKLWVFISSDETGEGVCAMPLGGILATMVAADEARVNSLIGVAQTLATESGKTIKLIKFSVREEIMEIKP